MTPAPSQTRQPVRAATAAFIGTMIEWYDFYIYATAAALVFGELYFPSHDPFISTMASFATFAVGFFARPLGGVIFGHLGDKIGRKKALMTTLMMMGVATVCVGLLPAYAKVGVLAPLLLVLLRVVQGIAVGGEWGGAVLMAAEHAPKGRRTFFASFAQLGSPAGLILSLIAFRAVTSMPHEEFIAWGWRLPFLVSAVLLVVGVLIRMGVNESPEFERQKLSKRTVELPIAEVFRSSGALVVRRRDEIADPRLPVCRRDHPVPHAAAGRVACRKDRRCALPEVDGPLRDDLAVSHVHPRAERQHGVDDYRYRDSRGLYGEFLFGDRRFCQRRVSGPCAVLGDFFVVSGLWSDCGWFDAARGDVACA